ncbi:hypothetical protein BJX64DRAFT_266565 [Aspergillus heterothallicus]
MAAALWTVFCASRYGRIQQQLGGIFGFCGWLRVAGQVDYLIQTLQSGPQSKAQVQRLVSDFWLETIGTRDQCENSSVTTACTVHFLETPVLLGHGTDDIFFSVGLGQKARQVLREVIDYVRWVEFLGTENEGQSRRDLIEIFRSFRLDLDSGE